MHVANDVSMGKQVKHDRCGNVIRQITKYPQRRIRPGQVVKVDSQSVLFNNGQFAAMERVMTQAFGQVPVEFDDMMLNKEPQQQRVNSI